MICDKMKLYSETFKKQFDKSFVKINNDGLCVYGFPFKLYNRVFDDIRTNLKGDLLYFETTAKQTAIKISEVLQKEFSPNGLLTTIRITNEIVKDVDGVDVLPILTNSGIIFSIRKYFWNGCEWINVAVDIKYQN